MKQLLDELESMPFPESPEDEALADWMLDLAEVDGYVAGLAATVVSGKKLGDDTEEALHTVQDLRERIPAADGLAEDDRRVLAACRVYVALLERVASALGER